MSNPFGGNIFDPIDDPFAGHLDPFRETLEPFRNPSSVDPFGPSDFGYPAPFPDPMEQQVRQFDHIDSMMDLCEKTIEQPCLSGDWRFWDRQEWSLTRVENQIEMGPDLSQELLDWAKNYGRRLSERLSILESEIEETEIPGPTPAPDIPSTKPLTPGGYVSRYSPLGEAEESAFYPGLSDRVRYQIRGSRAGVRNPSDVFCELRGERIEASECNNACQYYDQETQACRYGQDDQRNPEEESSD